MVLDGLGSDNSNSQNDNPSFSPTTSKSSQNHSLLKNPLGQLQSYLTQLEATVAERDSTIKQQSQEISKLQNEIRNLKADNFHPGSHMYQQKYQGYDRFSDLRQRVPEFKKEITRHIDKALETLLGESSSMSQSYTRQHTSWSTPPILQHRSDENSANVQNTSNTDHFDNMGSDIHNPSSAFQQVQDFRQNADTDLIQEATDENHRDSSHYNDNNHNANNHHNDGDGKSSPHNPLTNGGLHPNRRYVNGNNINGNNMNKRRPFTAFVAWTGQMANPVVRSLFDAQDIKDVRQNTNKSFAHIDFVSNDALTRALKKNGMSLAQHGVPGTLRVEKGKLRSNTMENNQRPQYQYPNQPQNQQNKGRGGFSSPPSTHTNFGVGSYIHQNGHNNEPYRHPLDDSGKQALQSWQTYSHSATNGNDVPHIGGTPPPTSIPNQSEHKLIDESS